MKTYLSLYYLVQFCGHSWIFTNMIARFFSFGKDAFADTFYAMGYVMRICQLLSVLELLHILTGIEKGSFGPRFLRVTERLIILFVVITSQEEVQGKYVVCILFFLWNLWDVTRYTYDMLSSMEIEFPVLTWLSHTLWIPAYPLSVLCEAYTIYESLPYFETLGTYSFEMPVPIDCSVHFPYILKAYLAMMPIGMLFLCSHLYSERKIHISGSNYKAKKKSD
ncbi:very-long-chain (3R)-3-hydroxyacyl-CoA dehydratase 4 isoform X2 [Ambystoma mexicanum]